MKEVDSSLVTSQPTDAAYPNNPRSDRNTPTFTTLKYYMTQYLYDSFLKIEFVVLGWSLGILFYFLTL